MLNFGKVFRCFFEPNGGVETHTCIGPAIRGVDKAPEGASTMASAGDFHPDFWSDQDTLPGASSPFVRSK